MKIKLSFVAIIVVLGVAVAHSSRAQGIRIVDVRLCNGRSVSCAPGTVATCTSGGWLCIRQLERCNFRDDDGDRRVDEEPAAALCPDRDGISCTVPTCVNDFERVQDGPIRLVRQVGAHCEELEDNQRCVTDSYACTVELCDAETGCSTARQNHLCNDGDPNTGDFCDPNPDPWSYFGVGVSPVDERGCLHTTPIDWSFLSQLDTPAL